MRPLHIFLFLVMIIMACDPYKNARHGTVVFSTDTLSFDTVFTSIGSVTGEFRAINKSNEPLLIDRVCLAGGESSPFRININGVPGPEADDIILPAGDSIFIFVDVLIDPGDETSPVSVVDSVIFTSGRYITWVVLEAWGQNILLIHDEVIGDTEWTEGKPYVVYSSLFVDTASTLTLKEGTRIFFHHNAKMTVAGTLVASGTFEKPVIIASDRITDEYEDVPGQWKGLTFHGSSRDNVMSYTELRNAITGVAVVNSGNTIPDLMIVNSKLIHHSVSSLAASDADIFAVNSLFAHTGFSTISLSGKGSCDLIHCTVANRWEYGYRSAPALFVGKKNGFLPEVKITNTVVTGNLDDEIMVEALPIETSVRITADSSMVKTDTLTAEWWSRGIFRNVITNGDPRFIDEAVYDFRPDTLSILVNKAGWSEALFWPFDIRRQPRPYGSGPDIGAYERQVGERRLSSGQ